MLKQNPWKILMLSLVLVQQNCLGKPTNNAVETQNTSAKDWCDYQSKYKEFEPSDYEHELLPTVQLLRFSLLPVMKTSRIYVEKAKPISEQILNDQEIINLPDTDEEVKDFKQNLVKFNESYKTCDTIQQLFTLVEIFSNTTTDFYKQEKADKLSSNGKIILKVLKKYEVEKLENDFEASFLKFLKQFEEKFESLREAIKEKESELSEKINPWYENFKTLKTGEEKIEAFEKFTKIFEIEDETT